MENKHFRSLLSKPENRRKYVHTRNDLANNLWLIVLNQIEQVASTCFQEVFYTYFSNQFNEYIESDSEGHDKSFTNICSDLYNIGLLSQFKEVIYEVLCVSIEKKVSTEFEGVFDQECLAELNEWIDTKCLPWTKHIFEQEVLSDSNQFLTDLLSSSQIFSQDGDETFDSSSNQPPKKNEDDPSSRKLAECKTRLIYFSYESLAKLRIKELFDIIIEYPDSTDSLKDLKMCLDITNLHNDVISSLRTSFKNRLLHPGANTSDILATYISSIKALHILDPSGTLQVHACKCVEEYLITRPDGVRCIISSLTDEDSESGLFEELENTNPEGDGDEDDKTAWNPKPIRSTILINKQKSSKPVDILSTLVSVFDGAELFINEYAVLLSEKLLTVSDFQVDKEIRTVELLKIKFGESKLSQCEIMLKDMADSKRIHTYINKNSSDLFTCTIVSHLFWPNQLKSEALQLPSDIEAYAKNYTKEYAKLKASRKLEWHHNMGVVELELEFNDGEVVKEFNVTPQQASVIVLFQEIESWTLEEIQEKLGCSIETTKKLLKYWMSLGVICEINQIYSIVENYTGEEMGGVVEEDENIEAAEDEDNGELEKFVVAMLKNLGALPLQRIHQMMVNVNSSYEKTPIQMQDFLNKLVAEGTLQLTGADYSVK